MSINFALVAKKILIEKKLLSNKAIVINNQIIEKVINLTDLNNDIKIIDYHNKIISPGFIDLQLNGCGGALLNRDLNTKSIEIMHKYNLLHGTTSFLPTLITCSDQHIKKAISIVDEIIKQNHTGSLGLHLEGPYIDLDKKGTHPKDFIRKLDKDMLKLLLIASKKKILRLITISPNSVTKEQVKKLAINGTIVSIGHSTADYKIIMNYHKVGLKMITHLFNAMPALTGRKPSVISACFDSKSFFTGIIVDLIHIDKENIRIAYNNLGDKLFLITDASFTKPNKGENNNKIIFGKQKCKYHNGKIINEEGNLAGSSLTMDVAVKNIAKIINNKAQALYMATSIPAIAIGEQNNIGFIKPNNLANLVILDQELSVKHCYFKGKLVN